MVTEPDLHPLPILALMMALGGCGKDVPKQPDCGNYACPAGTYPDAYREFSETSDDYVNVIKGECRYACVAAQACPDGWWPVITESCYTCATTLPSGENMGGSCDSAEWAYWYEDVDQPDPEPSIPSCRSGTPNRAELEEPDDTREQATDLGTVNAGLYIEGYMSITTDTYYCGDGDETGDYGEVDWFRFNLNCMGDATFQLNGVSSVPSLFVIQDGETVAAPAEPGTPMHSTVVEDLTGVVEVAVACWDAPSTEYWLEINF
ncbi:MAG: hypothetical protein CL927_08235 [Deltaproteobacteria bacterium]|nr:hypothetical protein [Deltaproteobacteria bacterium]HCH64318.1 hypothetical protein [Deltaproteobacteria bacterium]